MLQQLRLLLLLLLQQAPQQPAVLSPRVLQEQRASLGSDIPAGQAVVVSSVEYSL